MNVHKKISGKLVLLIIVCTVALVSVVFLFFTNFGCSYTPKFRPTNWISDQPESSKLDGCYFEWQCYFLPEGEARDYCYDQL